MGFYRIGLDLGGTKLLGLITENGDILHQDKQVLPRFKDPEELIRFIHRFYLQLTNSFTLGTETSIGLALPGPVDIQTGVVHRLTAFGWEKVPVRDFLEEKLGAKVVIENDVNAATVAEYRVGVGQGAASLFTFYPGTGLGGGYISRGKLIRGLNGTAGEVGHMVVQMDGPECSCGQRGCLEAIVSNRGSKNLVNQFKSRGKDSPLLQKEDLTGDDLIHAWREADPLAREILTYQARTLGIGVANVINITGVDRVIIGGRVFQQLWDELLPIVEERAQQYSIGNGMNGVVLRVNALGENAPALGMTLL
jgi:glucokinase